MYVLDLWPENLFSVMNIKNKILRRLVTRVSHWHYRKVDKIIVLSQQMKQRIVEITHISDAKIIVLPQACEKIYETPVADAKLSKRFANGFNVVFTGNISPAQSFNTIIDAAILLKKEGVHVINWIIVGDGMSKKQVEQRVKKEGLTSSFYFEGSKPIEDMPKYTEIADVLVGCLVKSELLEATIPAKIMSYIASGKPLVLAMDGEVQELINTTIRGGFVGPSEDYYTFAANIKKVYKLSSENRLKIGKRLKNHHMEHFERNQILDKFYRFIFT